jgi:hypothetical protein
VTALVCPGCGRGAGAQERFCASCGMPLVHEGAATAPEPREAGVRARKVKPQLTEGPLVRVAGSRHQPEAEFIQGLLLEEGVPSVLRRTAGFDVPDFLAAGPRDVLVPASGASVAREVLLQADLAPRGGPVPGPRPLRLLAGLLAALAVVALVAWVGTLIVG